MRPRCALVFCGDHGVVDEGVSQSGREVTALVAKSIAEDSKKIIADAQKQADAKIKEAEHKIMALVDEHEITKQATANANDIISKAQKDGREIKLAAIKFADDLLERVESDVKSVTDKIRQGRESLRQ